MTKLTEAQRVSADVVITRPSAVILKIKVP